MRIPEKIKEMFKGRKALTLTTALGIAGMLLIMVSSLIPEKNQTAEKTVSPAASSADAAAYCAETEKRLEDFLSDIEGAGEVRVYLTVGSSETTVYATEEKRSRSDNKTEEEEKYVMIGSGSDKGALIETVQAPSIEGAVIACSGCDRPEVQERIYKAVSAALGIPTAKIYVTKLR